MDKVAAKNIMKYQQSRCEELWQKEEGPEEQEAVALL